MMMQTERPARPAQVTSPEVAEKLLRALDAAMDDLLALLERETALVREGKLRAAAELAAEKEEKATYYTRLMLVARDEVKALADYDPTGVAALKRRHELFRAEVQINLAVLATAREVAEDLMRSVAAEVGNGQSAGLYGQRGALPSPVATAARGIALNRSL
jgi:hypothetical protein